MAYKTAETVLADISAALEDCIHDNGQKYVAGIIGHVPSTVSKRGPDADQYSVGDLVRLSMKIPSFARVVVAGIQKADPALQRSIEGHAYQAINTSAGLIQEITEALRDNQITPDEKPALKQRIRALHDELGHLEHALDREV